MENNQVMAMPKVEYNQGTISFENYETLLDKAKELAEKYNNLIITDADSYKFATQVRAELNKVVKAINDERVRIKKEYAKPLEEFEQKVKGITGEIEAGKIVIDKRVKEYDLLIKEQKQKEIDKLIQENAKGRYIEQSPKWLNKTYTVSKIIEDIQEQVAFAEKEDIRIETETNLIKGTAKTNDLDVDGFLSMYQAGIDVSEVITAINVAVAKRKEKQEREILEQEQPASDPVGQPELTQEPQQEQPADPFTFEAKETFNIKISTTEKKKIMLMNFLANYGFDYEITDADSKQNDLPLW